MTTTYEIPLTPQSQQLSTTLAGTTYNLAVLWRDGEFGGWFLDINDQNNNPIINGIPLVTGVDLLAQYEYLGLGFQLWVQTDNDPAAVPTYTNLGVTSHLYAVY